MSSAASTSSMPAAGSPIRPRPRSRARRHPWSSQCATTAIPAPCARCSTRAARSATDRHPPSAPTAPAARPPPRRPPGAARHSGAAVGLVTVAGVGTGRFLLRRHVTAIHAVSRFVETIVRRDLLDGDQGWEPLVERIDDVVPPPSGEPLDDAGQALVARLPSEPFILFVGQLSPHKGIGVLLRAYESLREAHPGTTPPLVLIGTPVAGAPLDVSDGVTLLESVPHAVVMAAWERSLFGVAPSVWPDPLPGVVREPMTR